MTINFKNVYLNDYSTVAGPYVINGPFNYDSKFQDFYDGESTFEKCEIKELTKSIKILFNKSNLTEKDIDLTIAADLLNQITISSFTLSKFNIPFIGVYNACASFCEELFLASSLVDSKKLNNIMCLTSSHNLTAERQYRNPVEYGAPKKDYQTFTVTGATASIVSSNKSKIKITSATIGNVIDKGSMDSLNMGDVMSPSAAFTLNEHLKDNNINADYYDLILTGDLGIYGKKIFKEYAKKVYNITLNNYEDAGSIIYDMKDKEVGAGGSGISCMPLVVYSYIIPKMLKGEIKKVLLIATGALLSTTSVNQKMSIPSISHAISLEAI